MDWAKTKAIDQKRGKKKKRKKKKRQKNMLGVQAPPENTWSVV